MKKMLMMLAVVLVGHGVSENVIAETNYAIDWSGAFYSINESDGTGEFIGDTGFFGLNSLEMSDSGVLYSAHSAGTGSTLISIDPITGIGSQIATISGSNNGIRSFAFSPNGTLFGTIDLGGPGSTGPQTLFTIDINTVQMNLIGSVGTLVQGLAFSPLGVLYGWSKFDGLSTIDPITAILTDVNPNVGAGPNIQTLDFSPDGTLYGGINNSLYTIGVNTGELTLIGNGSYVDIRGLVVTIPEPTTLSLLALGAVLMRKRKHNI